MVLEGRGDQTSPGPEETTEGQQMADSERSWERWTTKVLWDNNMAVIFCSPTMGMEGHQIPGGVWSKPHSCIVV